MVKQLIDGIKVQNKLTITLAKTKGKDNKIGNWLGAVSYMSIKVIKVFGAKKGNKNQGHGSNGRNISVLKFKNEAVAAQVEVVVGVVGEDAKAEGAPMTCYSMEWTANTSKNACTQARCNKWVLKETPTSLISAHRPTRKDMVTSNAPGGM